MIIFKPGDVVFGNLAAIFAIGVGFGFAKDHRGEAALVAAVSAKHRKAAFDACVALVDEVKAQIPIWKHQVFADGTDEWVNCA